MSDIAIDNLSVVFPDGTVGLDGVSLTVNSGEFVALVGPSGSGKTTLLRSVAGFIEPSSGTIALDGTDVSSTPPEKRDMGMVFQQHAVWPHMSVEQNVAYPLQRRGVGKQEQRTRVEATLEQVGLAGYGKRKPATLSGGQRQRVALARAIVSTPKVLLLDEALSALDEPLRDSLRRELVTLTRESDLTTVHVTHDRKEAIAIADRMALLRDGRLVQFDTPHAIVTRPATPWVASFIADAALLDARVDRGKVITEDPAFSWDLGEVEMLGEPTPQVKVAVLPEAVTVGSDSDSRSQSGEVTSVLFEVTGYSVNVKVGSAVFRARTSTVMHPEVGQLVAVSIARPLVYPVR